jgi:hypothetical protein
MSPVLISTQDVGSGLTMKLAGANRSINDLVLAVAVKVVECGRRFDSRAVKVIRTRV